MLQLLPFLQCAYATFAGGGNGGGGRGGRLFAGGGALEAAPQEIG